MALKKSKKRSGVVGYRKWSIECRYPNKHRTFTENNLMSTAFE